MAEMLSEAGYATGMYGKWHLGRTKGRFPTDQGFDEWYGIPNTTDESVYSALPGYAESGLPQPFVLESKKGEAPRMARPYDLEYRPLIDRDLTDRAIAFMKRQTESDKPFFIYLPYTATHFPTMPHPEFAEKSGKGLWGDMLMQIDSYVGELLDTIDDLGIAKNTIFIFTADNGPEALEAGGTSLTVETAVHGSAGPWRGTLFTGYEGALRVPFAIRWPDKISGGTSSDEIVHAMDLFPTFAKIAGGEMPNDRPIDGVDVSDFLLGKTTKSGREGFVVYMGNDVFGVKWRDWKIHFREQDAWNTIMRTYTMPRVINLISDPQEQDNVLFPHTWVLKAGLPQLEEHVASLKKYPPIEVGTPDPYEPAY
jgi:arylsulfatase